MQDLNSKLLELSRLCVFASDWMYIEKHPSTVKGGSTLVKVKGEFASGPGFFRRRVIRHAIKEFLVWLRAQEDRNYGVSLELLSGREYPQGIKPRKIFVVQVSFLTTVEPDFVFKKWQGFHTKEAAPLHMLQERK
ncbi:MAG: hypothetical protein HYW51_00375 [Candidatus Doudnabacteria bacterium]|nr:hypothetical protein [Candidatus Doudnabacteria bacterium]